MNIRKDTKWEEQLAEDEVFTKDGNTVVLLKGLQRLAEEAGLIESRALLFHVPSTTGGLGLIQCVYETKFDDGTIWVGAADCNQNNTTGDYLNYPTAIAESRAEARSLKKALGIRLISAEEIGFQQAVSAMEVNPAQPISENVAKTISVLCNEKGVDLIAVVEKVVKDEDRASAIYELSQLTAEEGQSALEFLNDKVEKKPSGRAARKQELLEKKNANV
jgi:hypothetical protein